MVLEDLLEDLVYDAVDGIASIDVDESDLEDCDSLVNLRYRIARAAVKKEDLANFFCGVIELLKLDADNDSDLIALSIVKTLFTEKELANFDKVQERVRA